MEERVDHDEEKTGNVGVDGGGRRGSVAKIIASVDGDKKGSATIDGIKRRGSVAKIVANGEERKGSVNCGGERRKSYIIDDTDSGRKGSVPGEHGVEGGLRRRSSVAKPLELDDVLANELGQFGWYQVRCLALVAIPMAMSAFMSEYVFSAAAVPHRCQIPECGESNKSVPFAPPWLDGAVPRDASCERFAPRGPNGTLLECPATMFDQGSTVRCTGYVYERDNSVVYDFDLGCREWQRALAGTLSSAGTLLVLAVAGPVSDRWGRRLALLLSVTNMAAVGILRAFSTTYPMYLALQLLQTTLGAGTFSSSYVFVAELVGPKYRVVTSATASSMFAIGQVVLGGVAWLLRPWRQLVLALHVPCLLVVAYYWLLDESARWLLSQGRYEQARTVLLKVARVNGTNISEKSLDALTKPPPPPPSGDHEEAGLFRSIWRSPALLRRVCTTPVWWVVTTLVYYGLSINSVSLAGNMYANYMATCAVEVPGFYTAVLVLDRWGRRGSLCGGYLLCSACTLAFAFLPPDLSSLRLALFLAGKFGISVVFTSLYLYTAELYPTRNRHTLLGLSSMVGRLGSVTAPLTPALQIYWSGLPMALFGALGLVAAGLVLTQPETLHQRLPDTLREAEAIGRPPPDTLREAEAIGRPPPDQRDR